MYFLKIIHIFLVFYICFSKFYRCAEQSKFAVCSELHQPTIPVEAILEQQGCTAPLWVNTLVLIGFLVVFRLLGYFVLRYVRCPK